MQHEDVVTVTAERDLLDVLQLDTILDGERLGVEQHQ